MSPEELKLIQDSIMQTVDSKLETIKNSEKPKEDSFTVKQFNEHQSTCHDLDCPACQSMNTKLVGDKIQNVNKLVDNISQKLRGTNGKKD